jgi:hypothetical protein
MCEQAVGSYRKAARYSEGRFPTGQPWRLCDFPATPAGHQVLRYAATPYEPKTSLLKMHGNHSCVAAVCSSGATASIHRSAKPGFLRVSTWVALLPDVLQRLASGIPFQTSAPAESLGGGDFFSDLRKLRNLRELRKFRCSCNRSGSWRIPGGREPQGILGVCIAI